MSTVTPNEKAASKVIAKACAWADRRLNARNAAPEQAAREAGRYKASRIELAEAVEKYREAEQRP